MASATDSGDQQVVVAGQAGKTVHMLLPILRKHSVRFHRIPVGEAVIEAIIEMPLVDLVLIAYPLAGRVFSMFHNLHSYPSCSIRLLGVQKLRLLTSYLCRPRFTTSAI